MAAKNNPSARKTEVVVQELKGEVLIYDLQNNKAYCLNETSALVYGLCDGNNSVSDISSQVSRKLKQPVTEDLIWLAIDQLKQDNLLENSSEIETNFIGLSRREAIRKVGLASMVALPIITGLIAPTAAQAQSGGIVGCDTSQICTKPSDCVAPCTACTGSGTCGATSARCSDLGSPCTSNGICRGADPAREISGFCNNTDQDCLSNADCTVNGTCEGGVGNCIIG